MAKKHHYVPQGYLRNFSSNHNNIYLYDKENRKNHCAAINDIAQEKHFYDLSGKVKKYFINKPSLQIPSKSIEDFFSHKIENSLIPVINDIIKRVPSEDFSILDTEISRLSEYLYYQLVRTREKREFNMEFRNKVIKVFHSMNLKIIPDHNNEEGAIIMQVREYFDMKRLEEFKQRFANKYWIIVENRTEASFYASDHPVASIAHKIERLRTNAGLYSEGIEITFPISSKFMLVLLEKSFFDRCRHQHKKKVVITDKAHVDYYNWLQIKDSYRQIYCENNSFQIVDQSYKRSPHLFDIDRPRIDINLSSHHSLGISMHSKILDDNIDSTSRLGKPLFV